MQAKWKIAADLLEEAARTIRQRSAGRDAGDFDTIEMAADSCDIEPIEVLDVMLALKGARYTKAGDRDSAIDWLAYRARAYAEDFHVEPQTDMREWGPPIDAPEGVSPAVAERIQREEAAEDVKDALNVDKPEAMS